VTETVTTWCGRRLEELTLDELDAAYQMGLDERREAESDANFYVGAADAIERHGKAEDACRAILRERKRRANAHLARLLLRLPS